MSPDPLYLEMHRLADPQQWNIYAYTRNNPLKFSDPDGLDITCGGDRCDDYLKALSKDVSFNIDYDKDGKVVTVGDIDQKSLSKSDKAFLNAIDDTKHHVTINAVGGEKDTSTFFGKESGSNHTINFDQAALLDNPKNAGGMTSSGLVGHETLEAYSQSKNNTFDDAHDWAATLGFPGMTPVGGTPYRAGGMVLGINGNYKIQGTNTVERINKRYATPIPQAEYMKNLQNWKPKVYPSYPVSVEKK
jgi:hypothetical protein